MIQRTACSVAGFTIPVSSSRNNIELSVAACLIGCGEVVLPQRENSLLLPKNQPYDFNTSTIVVLPLPVVPVKSNDGYTGILIFSFHIFINIIAEYCNNGRKTNFSSKHSNIILPNSLGVICFNVVLTSYLNNGLIK